MNTYAVLAVFAADTDENAVLISVGGYGMRSALLRLLGAIGDVPILSVCVTDSCASVSVPTACEDAAFSSVCREFQI